MMESAMLPIVSALFIIAAAVSCSHTAELKLHQYMTPAELRSVFHVEELSDVPQYHLVQLIHHVSRRNIQTSRDSNALNEQLTNKKHPHVKQNGGYNPPSLLNDEMFVKAREHVPDVDIIGDLNRTVSVHFGDSELSGENVTGANETESKTSADDGVESFADSEQQSELDDDTHRINLNVFGEDMDLVLKKQKGLIKDDGLKLWTVLRNDSQPHGVDYMEIEKDENEDLGELYQDEKSGTALLIRRHPKKGHLLVEGSIGHDVVIKPIPDSMSDDSPPDDEMFLDNSNLADMVSIDTGLPLVTRKQHEQDRIKRALSGARHIVIKREQQTFDHTSDYAFMEPDHLSKKYRRRRSTEGDESRPKSRSKRAAPYVIYPEILVIVDYDGYRLHGGDNVQIKRYFVSFWNGVDLRYKLLKGPKVRISIAGIIISRGRDATPYLERNRVGRDAIDSAAALTDMGKYLFRERRLPVYDIAVAITKLDMCRRQYPNDACNRGTAGFAYVGGACVVNKRLEKVNSVAIIEDTGGFSGIIVAAHEVGHLLGAVHDGSPPPSYLGGPGAEKCRWEDGYIMSDLRHTEKGFRWSPCSVHSFHHFLNGDTATCLYNSPHDDESLPRVLPGRLLTLDAQCRRDRGTSACFKDERVCAQLFCFDAGSGYCVAYRPAAEGSPCGDGQYCVNGRCMAEHENIIPDYSQHTPNYIRADASPFFGTNITSYETSTQPYSPTEITKTYFQSTTKEPEVYYSSVFPTLSTPNPFKHIYYTQSSTRRPYEYSYTTPETKPTGYILAKSPTPFIYNKYTISSTQSPYDFKDYTTSARLSISTNTDRLTTRKHGKFLSKEDLDEYFNKPTTKNTFARLKDYSVKPLYKIGTFYEKYGSDNVIRPDANSDSGIEVSPSRIINTRDSSLRYTSIMCLNAEARLRPGCLPHFVVATNQ